MANSHDLGDYREVNDRLDEFFERYPEGRITGTYEIREIPDKNGSARPHFIFRAEAYRTDEDHTPAVGHAQEPIPGLTPYTKGSELMNAETSAWGRALVALGIKAKGEKVASANEVRNRKVTSDPSTTNTNPAPRTSGRKKEPKKFDVVKQKFDSQPGLTDDEVNQLVAKLGELGVSLDQSMIWCGAQGVEAFEHLVPEQAYEMVRHFEAKAAA